MPISYGKALTYITNMYRKLALLVQFMKKMLRLVICFDNNRYAILVHELFNIFLFDK